MMRCEVCNNLKDTPQHEYGCSDAEEVKLPEGYDASEYPGFAVTVDLTIFTIEDGELKVLLIERGGEPYKGRWALPGGFVNVDESAEDAAVRELWEETHVKASFSPEESESSSEARPVHLEQLRTYSAPKRDPRTRVVSVAFLAFAADLPAPKAGDDAAQARWWPVEDVLGEDPEVKLAFDHYTILTDALERVRSKLEYTTLATEFVKEPFTISDLWRVYKAVWGKAPTRQNFGRKVLSVADFVEDIGELHQQGSGPRARLYRRGKAKQMHPAMMR